MMKSEFEKMRDCVLYRFDDAEVAESNRKARRLCLKLQNMMPEDDGYREVVEALIPGFPKSAELCPPFRCDHGNGIHIGEHVFINYNCMMLDAGDITIGAHTLIGPNCSFYTPQHPVDYKERRLPQETCYPITVGEDTWIGGNVTVCPGVTIGNRCIIAAGSVVTRDVPDDCMAAGNPAVVKKKLG